MIASIQATGVNCFVTNASQPNLYFYFTNYIWHYLRNDGKAGLILMTKFLNNKDGAHLKSFILDKVEAIISYPRKYFKDFDITTIIVILKKGNNSANVSFLRIVDENVLLNPDSVRNILSQNQDIIDPSYKLKVVVRNTLQATENWRQYLLDQKFDSFLNLNFIVNINHHFTKVKRGNAEAAGSSSKLIFPTLDANTNNYYGNGCKPNEARIDIPASLNNYISYGIKNNDTRRHYSLEISDIEIEPAFHFPAKADKSTNNLLAAALASDADLNTFYNDCTVDFGKATWQSVINNAVNHTYSPRIIIPRADRIKHCVYYNPLNLDFTLSTNFVYCDDLRNHNPAINNDQQYKFITAFLLSAFGQVQFELEANNQEGLRKLEGFHIHRFKIIDLAILTAIEINTVTAEFDALNLANVEFSGDEGINTPRRNLDIAIGNIVFSRNNLGFADANSMVDYFELFLAELVEDRRI